MANNFIIDRVDGSYIPFIYLKGLNNTVGAVYEEGGAVRGRSEPQDFYSHTGPDVFNFIIQLAASAEESDKRTPVDNWKDVLYLKSFQFPHYGFNRKGPVKPPHQAIISIGGFFNKTGSIREVAINLDSPVDEISYPLVVECTFTFKVEHDTPPDLYDIRAGL